MCTEPNLPVNEKRNVPPVGTFPRPAAAARREREQIAMAMALSLAEEKARHAPDDNCRQAKTDHTIERRVSATTNEERIPESSSLPKQGENLAPPPTMKQIKSDFDIGCNGVV